jgi:electron transport complex protein RnfC
MIDQAAPLWHFHGGIKLPGHKAESTRLAVIEPPLPERLILPLQQHIGRPAKPCVTAGTRVLKGQLLATADGYVSAALHAPTSGLIEAIEPRPVPHPSGLSTPCIVLLGDGEDRSLEDAREARSRPMDAIALRHGVRGAGIVGLGGAAFPSAVKLNPGPERPLDMLILNGAECEPYITCDDMLMRERAPDILSGASLLCRALGVSSCLIGIEDDKTDAIAALESALEAALEADSRGTSDPMLELRIIPTLYPSGGEKQLIRILTGKEVPAHGIPAEIGIVCHNVGTALAVYEAVAEGRPLISRYVTVTGQGVTTPRNLRVRIGTPIRELIDACGGYADGARRLIMGGPMMGFALGTDAVPVVKGTNCILVATDAELPSQPAAMPCIRCGACVDACPANLLPQQLYWYARSKDFDKIQDYRLFDCIECGCCATVCPSRIPLVQYYRFAKTAIWAQEREKDLSDLARQRHEFRLLRQDRDKQERADRMRKKRETLKHGDDGKDSKKATIEAALERAKAKKIQRATTAKSGQAESTDVNPSEPR